MTFDLKTAYATYNNCKLEVSRYCTGGLYIGVWSEEDGPVADVTVNLDTPTPRNGDYAFVDTNNFPEAETMIAKLGIGKFSGHMGYSGYCRYPMYKFNMDAIRNYADMEIEGDTDPEDDMEIASSDETAGQTETENDTEDDAYNLAYSCLISASDEESPITAAEAAYTLKCWREEGEYVNVTPEAFAEAWNDVLEQLKGGRI